MKKNDEYSCFDLRVTLDNKINATSEMGDADSDFTIDFDQVTPLCNLIQKEQVDRYLFENLGNILYQALFPQLVAQLFNSTLTTVAQSGRKIRLRLTFDSPELSVLPWEYLYFKPTDFFFSTHPDISLSRYLRLQDKREIIKTKELNVLVIISAPKDLPQLDVNNEELIIAQAIQRLKAKGVNIDVDVLQKATLKEISHQLDKKSYQVIHFIGHATFQNGIGYVALIDNAGSCHLVDEKTFDTLFLGKKEICLFILNACKSAAVSSNQAFSGLAANLVKRGVPAVIAMQYSIPDRTAIMFAEEFYYFFVKGKPVDSIIQEVRRLIAIESGFSSRDFATPVIYLRSNNSKLFDFGSLPMEIQDGLIDSSSNIFSSNLLDVYRKNLDDLKFINRVYELNQLILNPSGPQYLQIYGTAGQGKSCLLAKSRDSFLLLPDTACVLVNFNNPSLQYKEDLINEIFNQLFVNSDKHVGNVTVSDIINVIVKQKKLKNFILMFDTTEFAADGLLSWIIDELLPKVVSELDKNRVYFKVIASGKYLKSELKRYHPVVQFEHILLTPFDVRAIGEMVKEAARIVDCELGEKGLDEIVRNVLMLTNGHPKCAKQIIIQLALNRFEDFESFSTLKQVFSLVLNTVETEVVNEPTIRIITREVRHVLDALCLFRRFLPGDYIIKPLIDNGFIKGKSYSPSEIIEKLLQTHLVNWQGRMYAIDPLVGRTLALRMRLDEPERYLSVNDLAIRLYDSWIIGKDLNGNTYPIPSMDESQADFIVEGIYHRVCLMDYHGSSSRADLEMLKNQLEVYRDNIRSLYGASQVRMNIHYLKNQLLEDADLQQMLFKLFSYSFQEVMSVLE